jgi:hypothetical protein
MERLTFKQYLDSKHQLLKAIENTPVAVVEYEVKKYCSLTVGETEEEKTLIGLKPKNKVIVEWRYDSLQDPTPESVRLTGPKEIDEHEKFATFWSGSKLRKWLTRHAKQGENNGTKI